MSNAVTTTGCASLAERYTDLLADPNWTPSRAHIEALRNQVLGAGLAMEGLCMQIDGTARVASDALAAGSALYRAYRSLLQAGRDRIIDAGGECDPVDVMEHDDPALIAARSAFNIVLQKAAD